MTRFHRYSPGNILLIMQQRPDASYVAGYHAWKDLGRQVQKGEHGIGILAPIIKTVPTAEAAPPVSAGASPPPPTKAVVGFKVATVFDIAQTQGKELPIPQPHLLDSGDWDEVMHRLIATAVPVPVRFAPASQLNGANGVWSPVNQTITVALDRSPDQQLKTLLHEWAHSVGVPDAAAARDRHTGREEIVAETTAFVLAGRMGLDTSQYTFPYVGHWAQGDPQKVLALTQAVSGRVQSLSTVLEQAAQKDPVLASVGGLSPAPNKKLPELQREEYEAG